MSTWELKGNKPLSWLWLSGLVLALDLSTKYVAQLWLIPYQPEPMLPFFNFTLVFNRGAAFSFLSDASGWQRWFFIILGLVAITVIFIWIKRLPKGQHGLAAGLSLILGGALGNVIDRVFQGQVTDFIDLYYGGWHWPAFNIADSAISIGVVFVLLDSFRNPRKQV